MIRIDAVTRGYALEQITVRGHGLRDHGRDSASCAAVSALTKALGLVLVRSTLCEVRGAVQDEGFLDLVLVSGADQPWVRGVWELAKTGLIEIQHEWPDEVSLVISETDKTAGAIKGERDGT